MGTVFQRAARQTARPSSAASAAFFNADAVSPASSSAASASSLASAFSAADSAPHDQGVAVSRSRVAQVASWEIGERSMQGYWQPIIYPFKTVMPIGVSLLLLQGFAELLRSIMILTGGGEMR